MQLTRSPAPERLISLVSMIDVLLIMLVFFMVTSTYLDLDMIPVAERAEDGASADETAQRGAPLMVRLGADGAPYVRGQQVTLEQLDTLVRARPDLSVTILPALRADTQSLVTLMDTLTGAGAGRLRILQVAAP